MPGGEVARRRPPAFLLRRGKPSFSFRSLLDPTRTLRVPRLRLRRPGDRAANGLSRKARVDRFASANYLGLA